MQCGCQRHQDHHPVAMRAVVQLPFDPDIGQQRFQALAEQRAELVEAEPLAGQEDPPEEAAVLLLRMLVGVDDIASVRIEQIGDRRDYSRAVARGDEQGRCRSRHAV